MRLSDAVSMPRLGPRINPAFTHRPDQSSKAGIDTLPGHGLPSLSRAAAEANANRQASGNSRFKHHKPTGRRGIRADEAPAAALNLLAVPKQGSSPWIGEVITKVAAHDVLQVRNTFLEQKLSRPPSLDRFLPERKAQSLPCSGPPSVRSEFARPLLDLELPGLPSYMINTPTGSAFPSVPCTPTEVGVMWNSFDMRSLSETLPTPKLNPPVLSLAEALANSGPGSIHGPEVFPPASGMPSRGSALHSWGSCRPCAFFYQEGCNNKQDCEFCHLCDPGERKRRKKERRNQVRQVHGVAHGEAHRTSEAAVSEFQAQALELSGIHGLTSTVSSFRRF